MKVGPPDGPADFETALSKTGEPPFPFSCDRLHRHPFIQPAGFGRFNVLLMFTSCICLISAMGQTTTMSLIFPSAHCDLNLSLADKGALNGITYVGMILSAIMWGFLADVLGRRNILFYGYLGTFVFDVVCGLSQDFWSLAFAKFCGGFM